MPELHCETITFPSSDGRHTSSAVLYVVLLHRHLWT